MTIKIKVYLYATELFLLGIIWCGFHDSFREGDVLHYCCWCYLSHPTTITMQKKLLTCSISTSILSQIGRKATFYGVNT